MGNTQRPRCSRGCCREEGLSLVSPTWFSTQICHPEEWVGVSRRTEHPPEHQRAHGPRQCWGALHFPHFHLPPCQDRFLPPAAGFGMRNPAWWHVGDIPVPAARRHCPLLHWGFGAAGAGFSSTCWVLSGDISVTQKVSFPRSQGSGVQQCQIRGEQRDRSLPGWTYPDSLEELTRRTSPSPVRPISSLGGGASLIGPGAHFSLPSARSLRGGGDSGAL